MGRRLRRKLIKIRQADRAQELGVIFQQIQKYERGANRIGASALYAIGRRLRVSLDWFFDGLAPTHGEEAGGPADLRASRALQALKSTPDGPEMAQRLARLRPEQQQGVLAFIALLVAPQAA